MFTGLVEETRALRALQKKEFGARLVLEPPSFSADCSLGDSIALNGCCLTLAAMDTDGFCFDLLHETLLRTNLGDALPGDAINLERPLRANARLGGHFVQGHVDGTSRVLEATPRGEDLYLRFELPASGRAFLVEKGSIAVNGVSLTVATLDRNSFGVWIIPHTLQITNLAKLAPGARVNLEYDMLAKYVIRFLELREVGQESLARPAV